MWKYLYSIFSNIPFETYVSLGLILLIGTIALVNLKRRHLRRYFFLMILVEYVAVIFMTTVVYRSTPLNGGLQLVPFWSYRENGDNPSFLMENFANILAFVPVGFLLGYCFARMSWWKALAIGSSISLCIELLQLVFNKGLCELDDVIHNTFGCVVGYGLYRLLIGCVK